LAPRTLRTPDLFISPIFLTHSTPQPSLLPPTAITPKTLTPAPYERKRERERDDNAEGRSTTGRLGAQIETQNPETLGLSSSMQHHRKRGRGTDRIFDSEAAAQTRRQAGAAHSSKPRHPRLEPATATCSGRREDEVEVGVVAGKLLSRRQYLDAGSANNNYKLRHKRSSGGRTRQWQGQTQNPEPLLNPFAQISAFYKSYSLEIRWVVSNS